MARAQAGLASQALGLRLAWFKTQMGGDLGACGRLDVFSAFSRARNPSGPEPSTSVLGSPTFQSPPLFGILWKLNGSCPFSQVWGKFSSYFLRATARTCWAKMAYSLT